MTIPNKISETTLKDELDNACVHIKRREFLRAGMLLSGLGLIYAASAAVFMLIFIAPWFYSPYAGVTLSFYGGLVIVSAFYSRLNFFDNWPTSKKFK